TPGFAWIVVAPEGVIPSARRVRGSRGSMTAETATRWNRHRTRNSADVASIGEPPVAESSARQGSMMRAPLARNVSCVGEEHASDVECWPRWHVASLAALGLFDKGGSGTRPDRGSYSGCRM